jgi:hypothetical protein
MDAAAETSRQNRSRGRGTAAALAVAAVALFVAAGLLLWSRHGEAVFSDYVTAALAWCF